jgi:citrate synthase
MGALFSPGLEGVVTAVTSISNIDPQGGLAYRGYDIRALAKRSTYEEVAFLLLYGRLPHVDEFERFFSVLANNRELPNDLLDVLRRLPPKAHPMDVLRTAVALLGTVDPEARDHSRDAVFRKTIRTIAKLPTIIASSCRISQRLEPIQPMRQLTHAQNLLYMLSGYGPDEDAVNVLDRVLILYAEHQADVSSFTARVAASSFTDYHSALLAAIGSLKGRLDGGASEQVLGMLRNIKEADKVEDWIKDALKRRQRIMGFGDRVYKQGDTRAQIMKNLSRDLAEKIGDTSLHSLCEKIEEVVFREKGLHHNLNFYAGPILTMLGVPADLCTPIFAAGRIAGWSAHIIEQFDNNRLARPRFAYQGPEDLTYQPLEARDGKTKDSDSMTQRPLHVRNTTIEKTL